MFKFNPHKLKLDSELGSSSSAQVFPYQKNSTDDQWVVKVIKAKDTQALINVLEEVTLGFRCDHENILPVRGYHVAAATPEGFHVYVKMSRMKMNLKDMMNMFISQKNFMPEEDLLQYFYTIACGLEYLHNKREIPHRNIKPSNIMVSDFGSAKLSDISAGKRFINNDSVYVAPEVKANRPKAKKRKGLCQADVWSLGVVMAELCLLDQNQSELAEMLKSENEIKNRLGTLEKRRYQKRLLDLICSMLIIDPEQRSTSHEVKIILEEILMSQRNFSQDEEVKEDLMRKREVINSPGNTSYQTENTDIIQYSSIKTDVENRTDQEIYYLLKQVKESLEKGGYQGVFGFEKNKELVVNGLDGNLVTDKGIKDFMTDLEKKLKENRLTNFVKSFEFNLTMCDRVTDVGITFLSASIAMTFPNLESLSLGFIGCTEITDQGIRDLELMGVTLGNLKNLVISLRWCGKITNKGIEILASLIGDKFNNLQQLWIDFRNCSQMTVEGIQSLANSLGLLKQLKDLKLNFAFTEITDLGLKAISSCIGENLQKLNCLNLIFTGCDKITNGGVKDLSNLLKVNGAKLKELSLDFRNCPKLVDQTKLAIISTLNRVYKLNILF